MAEEPLDDEQNDWGRSWERGRNRSEEGDETYDSLNEQAEDWQEDEEQDQKTLNSWGNIGPFYIPEYWAGFNISTWQGSSESFDINEKERLE